MAHSNISAESNTPVRLSKVYNMVKAQKKMQTAMNILVSLRMENTKVTGHLRPADINTRVLLKIMFIMDKEHSKLSTAMNTRVLLSKVYNMVKAHIYMRTAMNILVSLRMENTKVTVH